MSAAAETAPDDASVAPALPFLKWVGGKRWLAPTLAPLLSARLDGRYIEPFGGGAAVLFHLAPRHALLGDINAELIETFEMVRAAPLEVVRAVWRFSNTPECYYRVRGSKPRTAVGRAARFIYLNRTAWGGIYRLNGSGAFNVPFGSSGRAICRKETIVEAARVLAGTEFAIGDFADTIGTAGPGDVVYADPPYVGRGLGPDASFARYHFPPFSWNDQERLAASATAAARRGAAVFVTARADVGVVDLYPGWDTRQFTRTQRVSRRLDRRVAYTEILLSSA